jgi:NAD+ synthase (glutamine-hydrolysing)
MPYCRLQPVRLAAPTTAPDWTHFAVKPHPYAPEEPDASAVWCRELLNIQAAALAGRMEAARAERMVMGFSGGLDSTLALLVCAECCDLLNLPHSKICCLTMPGFGTTSRTRGNAESLATALGVEFRAVDIQPSVLQHFKDINHNPGQHDVVYENSQARERTQILMDIANGMNGLVVGTGDLSEIALGWCTFNGDHMAMYGVNGSIPKTLMRTMVEFYAATHPALAPVLRDILSTPVSPELLPGAQETERILGSYELHDFFLYHFVKYGEGPDMLQALAEHAFASIHDAAEIRQALSLFVRRFFTQQFKRNTSPDGPKASEISLSPHGDWEMPSDASFHAWRTE